jgi:hypothetical protein
VSDRRFPPRGTDAVLALGLVAELAARRPGPPAPAAGSSSWGGADRPGAAAALAGEVVDATEIGACVAAVVERYAAGLRRDVIDDPVEAAGIAIATLEAFDLLRRVAGGWRAQPTLARYRLEVTVADEELAAPWTLFDTVDAGPAPRSEPVPPTNAVHPAGDADRPADPGGDGR